MKIDNKVSLDYIVNDFEHTFFVDAGAGSGKTTAMVSRIITILKLGLADLTEVAAITFTNEGAASLKNKIQNEIEQSIIIEKDKLVYARLKNALDKLPLSNFSTIHSFCLSLLKERPIESGIDPLLVMNMGGGNVSCLDAVWNKYLLQQAECKDPFFDFVLKYNIDLSKVRKIAEIKVSNPDLDLYAEKIEDVTTEDINFSWNGIINTLPKIKELFDEHRAKDSKTKVGASRINDINTLLEQAGSSISNESKLNFLLNFKLEGDFTAKKLETLRAELSIVEQSIDRVKSKRDNFIHYNLSGYVNSFEKYYTDYKKKNSVLEFIDLLNSARILLKYNKEVREYFKRKFKYVFVDEAQDTDPIQTEIVFFLCEKEGEFANEWEKVQLVPSKLFFVGDPKQSIYKFRRADIQIYNKCKEVITKQGGIVLSLSNNYRSSKEIIDFINFHFPKQFTINNNLKIYQVEYSGLESKAPNQSKFDNHLFNISSENRSEEIQKIIYLLKELVDNNEYTFYDKELREYRKFNYSDITILFNNFIHIEEYSLEFEKAGIPFSEVGGKTFFMSEDVRGIIYALKAIDNPTDTVSLFGALKSPLFGIKDKELFDYVNTENSKGYKQKLNLYSDAEDQSTNLGRALAILSDMLRNKSTDKPSEMIKKLLDATGLPHLVIMQSNGIQKISKYYSLLELCYETEKDSSKSNYQIISSLEKIMNTKDSQISNINIAPAKVNCVRIMTIHKSKGLEAPIIFLADADCKSKKDDPISYAIRETNKIIIPFNGGGFYSIDKGNLDSIEKSIISTEEERLRYVAATRAKDILVLCTLTLKSKDTFSKSFIGSIMDRKEDFKNIAMPDFAQSNPKVSNKAHLDVEVVYSLALNQKEDILTNLKQKLTATKSNFMNIHQLLDYGSNKNLFISNTGIKRGKAFGNVIHRLMEAFVCSPEFDINSIINKWIDEENMLIKFKSDAISYFNYFKNSAIVQEAVSAIEKFTEWEFMYKETDGTIITGVIDLLFKDKQGNWVIVDYKTDDISDSEHKLQIDVLYNQQIQLYKKYFELISGNKVSRTEILYMDSK